MPNSSASPNLPPIEAEPFLSATPKLTTGKPATLSEQARANVQEEDEDSEGGDADVITALLDVAV